MLPDFGYVSLFFFVYLSSEFLAANGYANNKDNPTI